jgi:alcohol dehydrogenase class IV
MLKTFENNLPRRIRFGRGVSLELAGELRRIGKSRPFIVTDQGVKGAGLLAHVTGALSRAGIEAAVYDRTEAEPPFSCVAAANVAARTAAGVDVIVALGGGSVIDTAKLVAATAQDGRDASLLAGIGKVGRRPLALVCIPTTSGTGSEATAVGVFTDSRTGMKVGVLDPCLVPDLVLLDPELTDKLPPLTTAAAGMDAIVHALEAYIARSATPLARGLALEAARSLGPALPAVCRDPGDKGARDAMLVGSHLAGMAFANASCCAVHALALPLGGRFHIVHGVVTGCLAAETMRHNLPACGDDFARFADALGWGAVPPGDFPDRIRELARSVGLQKALRSTEVPDDSLAELARGAVSNRRLMDPNPLPMTEAEAIGIYRRTLQADA